MILAVFSMFDRVSCGLKISDVSRSHCCPAGELWWTGCSLKRLIIAHHGIMFWLQGQPLGREHTHSSCHTGGVWWFLVCSWSVDPVRIPGCLRDLWRTSAETGSQADDDCFSSSLYTPSILKSKWHRLVLVKARFVFIIVLLSYFNNRVFIWADIFQSC